MITVGPLLFVVWCRYPLTTGRWTTGAAAAIARVNGCSVMPHTFVAVMVKADVPAPVGVPEMIPVAASNTSPAGRVPAVIANVVPAPPEVVAVNVKALPTVPAASATDVNTGTANGTISNAS